MISSEVLTLASVGEVWGAGRAPAATKRRSRSTDLLEMGERALQEKMEEISKMEQDYHILKEQVEKLRGVDEATDSQPSSPTKPFSPVSPSSEETDAGSGSLPKRRTQLRARRSLLPPVVEQVECSPRTSVILASKFTSKNGMAGKKANRKHHITSCPDLMKGLVGTEELVVKL